MLKKINRQLDKHHLIIKDGMKVDASFTESPFKPKGKITYELAADRQEDQRDQKEIEKEESFYKLKKVVQPSSDEQARWVKKRGKNTFGYKKYIGTGKNDIVLVLHATSANKHDSKGLEDLLEKVPKTQRK